MRSAFATRLVNASTGDHRRVAASGLSLGTTTRITGGIVCGDHVSNAGDHPRDRGVKSTPYPTTASGRATATRGRNCPARSGRGSPGVPYVARPVFRCTWTTSPPDRWAGRITHRTFVPCVHRAITATGRPVVRGGRGLDPRGVPTATSNPQARVRAGRLFGFGGTNRFGGRA